MKYWILILVLCFAISQFEISACMVEIKSCVLTEQLDHAQETKDVKKLASAVLSLHDNYDAMAYAMNNRDEQIKENHYAIGVLTDTLKEMKEVKVPL